MELPHEVMRHAFVAANGEWAVPRGLATMALVALASIHADVVGWEMWVIDHDCAAEGPLPAPGRWCGLIPTKDGSAVIGGSGDAIACGRQIAELDLTPVPRNGTFLRINFTY